jgi:hypothetical protein
MMLEGLGKLKKNPLHRDSIPRPSGLQHSASTNYATACPQVYHYKRKIYNEYILKFKKGKAIPVTGRGGQ